MAIPCCIHFFRQLLWEQIQGKLCTPGSATRTPCFICKSWGSYSGSVGWYELTSVHYFLWPPRSSSHSISSCQSESAVNQSPLSSCCLCLRKCSPTDNHWMLYCINAASLCQHLTFHKGTSHTKVPWSVLSQPWAAARGEVHEVQHTHGFVRGTLGAALSCPSTPNTLSDEWCQQLLSCTIRLGEPPNVPVGNVL